MPKWVPVAAVALLLVAAGAVVLLVSGGSDDEGSGPRTAASTSNVAASGGESGSGSESAPGGGSAPSSTSSTPLPASRVAILDVLHQYENAYSNASVSAMGALLAADVQRHGLAVGGCSTETGKRAVLRAYESQFSQNGPIGYSLVGLSDEKVKLIRNGEARVAISYSIPAANNSGPISFTLVDRGGRWQISEVDATCNPGSP